MSLLPGVIQAVLDAEDTSLKFEGFCIGLCSKVYGISIVPTSKTWDRGRDGRAVLSQLRGIVPVLCVSLRKDIEKKVEEDISRIAETTETNSVIYCSSQNITEDKIDKITKRIFELYPGLQSVQVLGQSQLLTLIDRNEEIFTAHYAAEIANVERALLLKPAISPDIKEIGLRLALCTQVGENANELRQELIRCLVLYSLNSEDARTPKQLASTITAELRLPRALSPEYIGTILEKLSGDKLIHISDNTANITQNGQDYITDLPKHAGVRLLEGRSAVREAIKTLSGHTIDDSQYTRLWEIFQDGITQVFYAQGLSIVRVIRSVLADELTVEGKQDVVFSMENLADRITTIFTNPTLAQEIRQSIIDMFFEKGSKAFDWLTQICSVYVMMCSLGLEELSSQQIIKVLSTYHVIPDSDIIISLLCEGENNHEDVVRIIHGWNAIGGKLFVTTPVLEEVAYHAWNGDYDYSNFGVNLSKISDYDAEHVIDNAFVRTFRKVAGKNTAPKNWNSFIANYRGARETDYSRIMDILEDEFSFKMLSESVDEDSAKFTKEVADFIIGRVSEYRKTEIESLDSGVIGKAQRDGRLISVVNAERQLRKDQRDFTTSCIISSAALLKEADLAFRKILGPPEMVLSTAAISFLLTLTPQVSMGFGTLRSVLFDTELASRFNSAQSYAYRLISSSGQWDIPYARRATLQRQLGDVLYEEARLKGEPVSEIREKVLSSENPEYSAEVIVATLSKMAISSKDKEELIRTKSELRRTKEELEALRRSQKRIAKQKRTL